MLVAQISDLHIRPEGLLYEGLVNSNKMCREAIEHLHQLDHRPDLVMITGDIVDKGTVAEYEAALKLLSRLEIPYLVIPGNHDNRENFRKAFSSHDYLPTEGVLNYCVDEFPVRFIGLDSCVPDYHYGDFSLESLKWLESTLAEDTIKPTLVMMHHHPFNSGISYLDKYRHEAAVALESIFKKFSNIEAVVCGHVHRVMFKGWGGTIVSSCPSTTTEIALQLTPQAKPQSYEGVRACLLHFWSHEQGLISHVSYVGKFKGPYPFA